MSELNEKVKYAIKTLKSFTGNEPYYLCYSGGKDSDVIRILADLSNVDFEVHHNHTTVDTPTTVRYVREIVHSYGDKGFIHYPDRTMWQLIVDKMMPPTRIARYCCAELKEKGGFGRRKVTGVRKAESVARAKNGGFVKIIGQEKSNLKLAEDIGADYSTTEKGGIILNLDNDKSRLMVESCYRTSSVLINPIFDWSDKEVWEFLKCHGCDSNPEYACGEKRIGCIGCPLSGKSQKKDLAKYPKYRENYVRAFDRMLNRMIESGKKTTWKTGEYVMRWWVGDDPLQMTMEDYLEFLEEQKNLMTDYIW